MKRLLSLSIGVCSLWATTLSAVSLVDYIEPDVQVFASVRNLSETTVDWEKNPIAALLEEDSIQAFMEAVSSDDGSAEDEADDFTTVMKEEFGLTWNEFFELFPGQMTLAFYNLTDGMLDGESRDEMVLMAEFSGDEDRINELMQIQFLRNAKAQKEVNPLVEHVMLEESFMGETLHMDETFDGEKTYIEDGYALVDGVFILATEERLRRTVEMIKEGGASVAQSDAYLRTLEDAGRGDFRLYINLSEMMAPLNEAMVAKVMEGGLAMFGVTGKSMESALSLESLQAAFVDFDLVDEGLRSNSGLIYREKAGWLRLLAYRDDELPAANYVPEGVLAATVSTFDFSEMLSQLEQVLALASPSVPMLLDIQLQQTKTQTGIDFRAAVLENLSGDVVSLSVLEESSRGSEMPVAEPIYVLGVKDAQTLSHAMESLKDLVPGARDLIETQDYEGQTIHTFKAQQQNSGANDVNYVITRSELIVSVGRIGLLQELLSRMTSADRGFWQLDETEEMFEQIAREHAVTRSYLDLEQMAKPMLQSILQASSMGGMDFGIDVSKMPSSLDVPMLLISETNEAPDGLFMRMLLLKREVAK